MDYLDIANSKLIYGLGAMVILFVLVQCTIFLVKAWKRGIEIGLTKEQLMNTVKQSAIFSIVPSLPIIVSLIAMAPVLGVPFPWIRLSIVGSAPYELISAGIGAKSMGVEGLGAAGYTAEVFANSMWVMSFGIIWGLLICIVALKKIQKSVKNTMTKNSAWAGILISALFFGMISVFLSEPIVKGGVPFFTLLTGGAIMFLITIVERKFKVAWLGNFALSISMIFAMVMAIVYTNIII